MKTILYRKELLLKFAAVAIATMIVISSIAMIEVMAKAGPETEPTFWNRKYQSRPCNIGSVQTRGGTWVYFVAETPGTPADAQITISDTTGITIVANFHGFWRGNTTIDGTLYDVIKMPGADSISEPGKPMLPVLTELVEIPHDINVSIDVLTSSHDNSSDYNIRPAPPLNYPVGIGRHSVINATNQTTILPTTEGSVYEINNLFPGVRTDISGRRGNTPLIVRGHRLLKLSFYPVQFNPETGRLMVFSQMVIKIRYSTPAQIQPVRESLRSSAFEQIFKNSLIHYDPIHFDNQQQPGIPISYSRIPLPPSLPNATVPIQRTSIPPGYVPGAEYLIITTDTYKIQAQRLADWKERKGTPSEVIVISERTRDEKIIEINAQIKTAYEHWYPAPTYVLLFGDVEDIPTNYEMIHPGFLTGKTHFFDDGYIGSDLGYFNIEGHSYFPDMIYSRISVDTEEQAEIIVNKTIQYEQSPPIEDEFYNNLMTAGFFEDIDEWGDLNGVEQSGVPFLYHLEKARRYLDELGYWVHYNYSAWCSDRDHDPEYYHAPLDGSDRVSDTLPEYDWLWGYDQPKYYNQARGNITTNIDDGRFLVLYYGHGGSKNMIYPRDWAYDTTLDDTDGDHNNNDRDLWEGWTSPFFNTSYFPALANDNKNPLIVSIACNTGWFDGETDHLFMNLDIDDDFLGNLFEEVNAECFAEEILRLEAGAIAAISPSRPSPARAGGDLFDGIVNAIWPGFLEERSQPIYEMGGILLAGKLHAASKWMNTPQYPARQIFEEFHLFGDPETQLWTAAPLEFNVTHPVSIGTATSQKFVVTVRNNESDEPISYAKICIQQDPSIYLVGYTDSRGQVVFDIDPLDISSSLNVTVTKHNHKPYLGEIIISQSQEATVTVTSASAIKDEPLEVKVFGFNLDLPVGIYFDDDEEARDIIPVLEDSITTTVPDGPYGYITVRAEQGNLIASTTFLRLSSDQNPDPYVYSYADTSTWHLAGEEVEDVVWDNPCITIYDGTTPVTKVTQNRPYTVNVTVYNRGSGIADPCNVTLLYSQTGGGVTWDDLGSVVTSVDLSKPTEVSFSWRPTLANTACLKVELDVNNERDEDKVNNVGYECWSVFPLCANGESSISLGNPSDEPEYIFINVKQVGHEDDVWSATVQGHSTEPTTNGEEEEITLQVEPSEWIGWEQSRLFTAEFYIEAELIGGVVFEGVCNQIDRGVMIFILMILLLVIMIALVIYCIIRD